MDTVLATAIGPAGAAQTTVHCALNAASSAGHCLTRPSPHACSWMQQQHDIVMVVHDAGSEARASKLLQLTLRVHLPPLTYRTPGKSRTMRLRQPLPPCRTAAATAAAAAGPVVSAMTIESAGTHVALLPAQPAELEVRGGEVGKEARLVGCVRLRSSSNNDNDK